MKFTEHLSAHITPEWRKQYIQYEVSSMLTCARLAAELASWLAQLANWATNDSVGRCLASFILVISLRKRLTMISYAFLVSHPPDVIQQEEYLLQL